MYSSLVSRAQESRPIDDILIARFDSPKKRQKKARARTMEMVRASARDPVALSRRVSRVSKLIGRSRAPLRARFDVAFNY